MLTDHPHTTFCRRRFLCNLPTLASILHLGEPDVWTLIVAGKIVPVDQQSDGSPVFDAAEILTHSNRSLTTTGPTGVARQPPKAFRPKGRSSTSRGQGTARRKGRVRHPLAPHPTFPVPPKIPGLCLKPGTSSSLVPAVPINLSSPPTNQNRPPKLLSEAVSFTRWTPPAILTAFQASVLLGLSEEDILYLVHIGEIPALSKRPGRRVRIALIAVLQINRSEERLAALCKATREHWKARCLRRRTS